MSCFFFFKQKTAYEMRISDWSSDVCSSDLRTVTHYHHLVQLAALFDHRHTDGGTSLYGHLLVGITNKGKNERSIVIRHINSKAAAAIRNGRGLPKIGRASCRERVCQYV